MTRKKKVPSPGTVADAAGDDAGSPRGISDNFSPSLPLSDFSSASSQASKDTTRSSGGVDEFFEGYRAGIRVQFDDDQVIMRQYREQIRQLQQEVEEYRRQERIKEEGRQKEREVEKRIRQELENEKVELEQEGEDKKDEMQIHIQCVRCRSQESWYRKRVEEITKDLNEANNRLLAMQIACDDVAEGWEWAQGFEWGTAHPSPSNESSDADTNTSTENTVMGHPSNNFHGDVAPSKSIQKAPGTHLINLDDNGGASDTIEHEDQLDGSKDCVAISQKGKGREPDLDAITQSGSSRQRPSGSSKNSFDVEVDVDTEISDSGNSGSDVEGDVKSLPGESASSISSTPEGSSTTSRDLSSPQFVSQENIVPSRKIASRSHISISDLDGHQLMALMKEAHEGDHQSGHGESGTPLQKVRNLISEAEKVPRQKRNALEIYLLTNWRKPSGKESMVLPDFPNQAVVTGTAVASVSVPMPTHILSYLSSSIHAMPTIFVDASGYGIGLVMPDGKWLAWAFNVAHPRIPIGPDNQIVMSWAELVAVELGVLTLIAAGHGNTRIQVRSDNDGVVCALLRQTWTNNYGLNTILERILSFFNSPAKIPGQGKSPNNLELSVKWIPSSENPADGPSRGVYPSKELMLKDHPAIPEYLTGLVLQVA